MILVAYHPQRLRTERFLAPKKIFSAVKLEQGIFILKLGVSLETSEMMWLIDSVEAGLLLAALQPSP
jgi:hypothetical protein